MRLVGVGALRAVTCVVALIGFLATPGCAAVYWLGIQLYYDKATLPSAQIVRDVPYDLSAPTDHKRQLDLFLPAAKDFPTVVFLHGGGWAWGDRSQKFGGADVYGNVGRFLAQQGYGAVVPSYRLIWKVDWIAQLEDVARAVAWAQQHMPARGGRPRAMFLMGHSAGAQLAMRVAADPGWLANAGGSARDICGVILASGAAYDLEDSVTRSMDPDKDYFEERFGPGHARAMSSEPSDGNGSGLSWRRAASPLPLVDASDPPFLVMLAENDYPSLHRQARLADERLNALGLGRGFVLVPHASHERIVVELSRADHVAGPALLKFLRETSCPRE